MRTEQEILAGFQTAKAARCQMYKDLMTTELGCFPGALESLNRHGYTKLSAAVSTVRLGKIKALMDQCIKEGRNIRPGRNIAALGPDGNPVTAPRLSTSEIAKGESHYRHLSNHIDIQEPLITCPPLVGIAFDENLLALIGAYLGSYPALGYIKLRRSYENNLRDFDTNFFHADGVGPDGVLVDGMPIVKIFAYLNRVDEEGGPTAYVEGSHRAKDPDWRATVGDDYHKDRWTREQMEAIYGAERVVDFTGDLGDIFIADTNGMHRGTKPTARDRDIVILNYGLDEEEFGPGAERPAMKQADYDRLTKAQKAAASYLTIDAVA